MVNLLRLGIGKLILVDKDVVDNHNLNRQLLYSVKDVSKAKVDAAVENSAFHNVSNTLIEGHKLDAVKEWKKIIILAK